MVYKIVASLARFAPLALIVITKGVLLFYRIILPNAGINTHDRLPDLILLLLFSGIVHASIYTILVIALKSTTCKLRLSFGRVAKVGRNGRPLGMTVNKLPLLLLAHECFTHRVLEQVINLLLLVELNTLSTM